MEFLYSIKVLADFQKLFAVLTSWQCLNFQVLEAIKSGEILSVPEGCDQKIADLIYSCWRTDPTTRPKFADVRTFEISSFEHSVQYLHAMS